MISTWVVNLLLHSHKLLHRVAFRSDPVSANDSFTSRGRVSGLTGLTPCTKYTRIFTLYAHYSRYLPVRRMNRVTNSSDYCSQKAGDDIIYFLQVNSCMKCTATERIF